MSHSLSAARRRLTRFAILCLWTGLAMGLLGSLLYTPLYPLFRVWGISLRSLRPLHLSAGVGWIYLAGLAVVVHFWSVHAPGVGRAALRFFLATWALGAMAVAVTIGAGAYGGREYFFVSLPASALFWVGWVALAVTFVRSLPADPGPRPVYIWMWLSSFGLFTYAFVETHAFLLPYFQGHPLRDMAVEWKSYGTLVGSFNLLVYGALAYLGERLGGNYARSRLAFSLFWVGILNSFTNYGHHTYHLPQSSIVHWTSFLVSMSEVVILAKVAWDVAGWARRRGRAWNGLTCLLFSVTLWTFASLIVSILISIPPLNAVIHGTFVVAGHAMGSMLGIDTIGLLAALAWMHAADRDGVDRTPRWAIVLVNVGIAVLWAGFITLGTGDGLRRWQSGVLPSASLVPAWFGTLFVGAGLCVATGIGAITLPWVVSFPWDHEGLDKTPEQRPA